MSQIQNNCLQYAAQPLAFFAAAFLAGRLVQHFPGATPKGLLLSAAIGSTTTLAAQRIFASKDESAWHSLARNVACLALAAFLTPYVALSLKGRADITLPAAFRFCAVEGIIAAGLVFVSSRQATVDPLYIKYKEDPAAWEALSKEERTNLIKHLYASDSPPLSLQGLETDNPFEDISPDAFARMTKNQLEWHVQLLTHVADYPTQKLFALNLALHKKNLPMNWGEGMTRDHVDYAEGKPACIDLLHAYFSANPIKYHQLQWRYRLTFDMFDGKQEIPDLIDALQALQPQDFQKLGQEELAYLVDRFEKNCFSKDDLTLPQLIAFNVATYKHNMWGIWIWPITQQVVDIVRGDEDALAWFHAEFSYVPTAYALIDEGLRNQLKASFDSKQLGLIEDAETFLDSLSIQAIRDCEHFDARIWCAYFQARPNSWQRQSKEKTTAFINAFIRFDQPLLPFVKKNIDFAAIDQPLSKKQAQEYRANQIRWLIALQKEQPFLTGREVFSELEYKLDQLERP